jgi:hypothetical protein
MNKNLKNKVNESIEKQSQALNAEISSKLNQARQIALRQNTKSSNIFQWFLPLATAFALMAYLVVPAFMTRTSVIEPEIDYTIIEEIELIEQYELVENLEFYEWLSQKDVANSI